MVDSGGFAFMRRPSKAWSAQHLIELFRTMDADLFVALDIPPLPTDSTRIKRRKWLRTLQNLEVMVAALPPDTLVPVVHADEERQLDRKCREILSIIENSKWVGIGGLVPYFMRTAFYRKSTLTSPQQHVVRNIRQARAWFPNSLLHAFGAGSPQTVIGAALAGADSADSTAWRTAAGFGSVYLLDGSRVELLPRNGSRAKRLTADTWKLLGKCSCPICRKNNSVADRARALTSHFEPRAIHNYWTLRAITGAMPGPRVARCKANPPIELNQAWLAPLTN